MRPILVSYRSSPGDDAGGSSRSLSVVLPGISGAHTGDCGDDGSTIRGIGSFELPC
jgi:hypothetical protein